MTSHDVVNQMRRRFSTKRVGHAGTLDPMASGLLVVAIGSATRFLQYLPLEPKEYIAKIRFGIETSTYDLEGQPSDPKPLPENLGAEIETHLAAFRGLIQQFPPMYSAVKVNGQPLYRLARQGQTIEREARTVHITEFSILDLEGDVATARIICSGGTYVRSLAHDLGQAMGCGAHLVGLKRTRVGRFTEEMAIPMSEIGPQHVILLADALPPMQLMELTDIEVAAIRQGKQLSLPVPTERSIVGLLDPRGNVFSVARVMGDMLQPECVIPAEVPDAVA